MTVCAFQQRALFGEVSGGEVQLSPLGKIARMEWFRTIQACEGIQSFRTEFVVMPNHIHGIIWIMQNGVPRQVDAWMDPPEMAEIVPSDQRAPTYLGSFIAMYKLAVIERAREELALRTIWQRNYSEHIIRAEAELHDLIIELRSLTLGVGTFEWKFDHLQELTGRLADKIVEQRLAPATA